MSVRFAYVCFCSIMTAEKAATAGSDAAAAVAAVRCTWVGNTSANTRDDVLFASSIVTFTFPLNYVSLLCWDVYILLYIVYVYV